MINFINFALVFGAIFAFPSIDSSRKSGFELALNEDDTVDSPVDINPDLKHYTTSKLRNKPIQKRKSATSDLDLTRSSKDPVILEDDMILSPLQYDYLYKENGQFRGRNAEGFNFAWKKRTVPYRFAPGFGKQNFTNQLKSITATFFQVNDKE